MVKRENQILRFKRRRTLCRRNVSTEATEKSLVRMIVTRTETGDEDLAVVEEGIDADRALLGVVTAAIDEADRHVIGNVSESVTENVNASESVTASSVNVNGVNEIDVTESFVNVNESDKCNDKKNVTSGSVRRCVKKNANVSENENGTRNENGDERKKKKVTVVPGLQEEDPVPGLPSPNENIPVLCREVGRNHETTNPSVDPGRLYTSAVATNHRVVRSGKIDRPEESHQVVRQLQTRNEDLDRLCVRQGNVLYRARKKTLTTAVEEVVLAQGPNLARGENRLMERKVPNEESQRLFMKRKDILVDQEDPHHQLHAQTRKRRRLCPEVCLKHLRHSVRILHLRWALTTEKSKFLHLDARRKELQKSLRV